MIWGLQTGLQIIWFVLEQEVASTNEFPSGSYNLYMVFPA